MDHNLIPHLSDDVVLTLQTRSDGSVRFIVAEATTKQEIFNGTVGLRD